MINEKNIFLINRVTVVLCRSVQGDYTAEKTMDVNIPCSSCVMCLTPFLILFINLVRFFKSWFTYLLAMGLNTLIFKNSNWYEPFCENVESCFSTDVTLWVPVFTCKQPQQRFYLYNIRFSLIERVVSHSDVCFSFATS